MALALSGCGGGSLVGEYGGNAPPSGGPGATIGGGGPAIVPAPIVSNVTPDTGDSSGGTTITITGSNFQTGATVLVGGRLATNVVVTNGATIQAVTAPNAPGTYEVRVTNPDGQSGTRLASFTYLAAPAPTLIQVLPNSGPSSGGTVVMLSGSNYQTGATVLFGGAAATSVTLISPVQLQVTTPSVPAGIVDVQVINPDSQSVTLTGGFTFTQGPAPTIASVSPGAGPSSGGTAVTVTGTNFAPGAVVQFGSVAATNIVVVSATQITVTTPPHAAGVTDLVVRNPDNQSATFINAFNFVPPPAVSSVAPGNGPLSGGTVVTITGSAFQGGAAVSFGGVPAASITIQSPTQILATTPAHAPGTVDVMVTNVDGQSGTLTGAFTFNLGPAPTITSVAPTSGPASGGTSVVITGTNFQSGAAVSFGAFAAANVTVSSATQITAVTAAGSAGVVDVTVTNTDGQSGVLSNGFDFLPAPSVASVSPGTGPTSGGTAVVITGANFQAGATVQFGATAATSVTVSSATLIQATSPAGAAGAVGVTVTNPDTQSGTLAGAFAYTAAPVVSSIAPSTGPVAGGTTVTITGANFVSGATVTFGANAATGVVFNSATSITAVSPAGAAGTVSVTVTNPSAQSGTLPLAFTYSQSPAPSITSVNPTSGAASGGTLVTIAGTDFQANATVSFGGTASPNVTVVSATSIQAVTPAHAAGAVNVVVTNPDAQTGTLTNGFTFNAPPTVTNVSPSSGPLAGGTSVTITGTNFLAGATVRIGGVFAAGVVVNSATSITAVTPAGAAGPANVNVINTDSQLGTLAGGFTYNPAPTVISVSPTSGPTGGGTVVQISGTGFLPGATVTFGATAATAVTVSSSTSILATSPAGAAGAVNVNVTNTDNQVGTLAGGFTYTAAPVVSSVSPSSGPTAGGTTVTITGANFVVGATVDFGLNAGTGVVVNSATSITAVTPAGAAGSVTVTVTNPSSQSGSLALGFSYTPPAPTVTSVNPTNGRAAGGTLVTITGTNFVANATVTFGGSASPNVTVVNATTIQAVTPAHAAGAVNVVVTNPDAQTGTLVSGYTFNAAPTVTNVTPNNGPLAGGTSITITGTNFMAAPVVRVGANLASGVVFNSATSITAVTPAGVAGSFSVTVINTDGQRGVLAGAFTYNPAPTVTSVSPTSGPTGGGTAVLITGTGFRAGATVTFGATAATGVVVSSATSILATSPAGGAGAVNVIVTNTDTQTDTLASGFTYTAAPVVSSVTPSSGPVAGGTTVTITGANFVAGATVTFGANPATGVVFNSATSLTAVSPAGAAGAVSVTVTNPSTQSGTLPLAFTYAQPPAPSITSVNPTSGPASGGAPITIAGANFQAGATVTVGGTPATGVIVVSAISITAVTPAHAAGTVNVVVTNPGPQSGTLFSGYTFNPAPTVTSVVASSGPTSGGTVVIVNGTNFQAGATILFGSTPATGLVLLSATQYQATTPAQAAGAVSVRVTNADGQSGTLASAFTYVAAPAPTVTAVSPGTGPATGGTTIAITGTNFVTGAAVLVGGVAATNVVVLSSTSISADTPSHAAGTVSVQVRNPDGQIGSLPGSFVFVAAPTIGSVLPNSGPTAGGTAITIAGTGFQAGASVIVGGVSATSVVVVSAISITAVTPAGTAGTVAVSVLNPDGQSAVLNGAFSYSSPAPPPTVTSILPINGSQNGGTTVTITGTGFQTGATVLFGVNSATGVVVNSATSITAISPPGTPGAAVGIRVTNPDTQSGVLPGAFAYLTSSVAIATTDLPEGNPLVPYTIGFAATGGAPPYNWTLSAGTLPPGLTLDVTSGFLSGVPTQVGSFSFTILATDKATPTAQTATANFTLDIVPIPTGPNLPQFPLAYVDTTMPVQAGTVRNVTSCSQLQSTINAAALGDTIVITSTLTCPGQFTLPEKTTGSGWIIIRSSAMAVLPPEGTRIDPMLHAPFMPKILGNFVNGRAIVTNQRAHHYRLIGLELSMTTGTAAQAPVLGLDPIPSGAPTVADMPHHIVVDRCYIHGQPTITQRRGIQIGGNHIGIIDSYISEIHEVGADSQAIAGWNFNGPIKIVNNYLEGAGENVLFGGAPGVVAGVVPSDMEIRRNHFSKQLSWRSGHPTYAGIAWGVKNLFEVKHGQRILFEGNLLEYSWIQAQLGYQIVLTPAHELGAVPQARVQDVVIRYNLSRHASSWFNSRFFSPSDPGTGPEFLPDVVCVATQIPVGCLRARRWHVHNNVAEDISGSIWGGEGKLIQVVGPVDEMTFENNTLFHDGSGSTPLLISFGGPGPAANPNRFTQNFVFRNNIALRGTGILGPGTGDGNSTLNFQLAAPFVFLKNVVVAANSTIYPANNFYPVGPMPSNIGFLNFNLGLGGDYRLSATSPYRNAGTNGKDIGARAGAVTTAVTGVQ
ncbi:MAG: IPT/TIG domain-containing protein [Acidobacteria bacterium]|nr:IPT/TIG domain-containing protein [Acidobacteriota bacterium]